MSFITTFKLNDKISFTFASTNLRIKCTPSGCRVVRSDMEINEMVTWLLTLITLSYPLETLEESRRVKLYVLMLHGQCLWVGGFGSHFNCYLLRGILSGWSNVPFWIIVIYCLCKWELGTLLVWCVSEFIVYLVLSIQEKSRSVVLSLHSMYKDTFLQINSTCIFISGNCVYTAMNESSLNYESKSQWATSTSPSSVRLRLRLKVIGNNGMLGLLTWWGIYVLVCLVHLTGPVYYIACMLHL